MKLAIFALLVTSATAFMGGNVKTAVSVEYKYLPSRSVFSLSLFTSNLRTPLRVVVHQYVCLEHGKIPSQGAILPLHFS
jgi:hypothetical protein